MIFKATEREIKQLIKKQQIGSAKAMAKALVKQRNARDRLYNAKANVSPTNEAGQLLFLFRYAATLRFFLYFSSLSAFVLSLPLSSSIAHSDHTSRIPNQPNGSHS